MAVILKSNTTVKNSSSEKKSNTVDKETGVLSGLGYLGEKVAVGFMQSVEGIWDYSAGGIAKLFGNDEWAEEQFANDWFGDWYSHPEEWFNPTGGWKVAGDVASGIGSSLPALAVTLAGTGIAVASGGAGTPLAAGLITAAASVTAGLGAAGTATKEAYMESGQLTGKEFGYGALSGVTEAGLEALTAGIGTGGGRIIKSLTKSATKEGAEAVTKAGVKTFAKNLATDFASEAFEEGFSEWISPYYKRLTYDPNARNASAQEIAYAALVGGLSGMVMTTGHAGVSRVAAGVSGNNIVNSGKVEGTLELGRIISEFEAQNKTGDEVFTDVADVYKRLTESLAGTDGQITTFGQKMMLSDLRRTSTAAIFGPLMKNNAAFVVENAPAVAERLSSYYTDANGKAMTVTAKQLMSGLTLDSKGRITEQSYAKAIKENDVLRTVVAQMTAGQLMMDADRFAMSAAQGNANVTQSDLNAFVESAGDSNFSAVSEALGVDLASADAATVNARIRDMDEGVRSQLYATAKAINEVKSIPESEVKGKIPIAITMKQDGSVRYSDGETKIAITKDGDSYYIYDYATGNRTNALTKEEANKLLRQYRSEKVAAEQAAREGKAADTKTKKETERARQAREIDELLRKEVKDYAGLSDANKGMIRKVYRTAISKGISTEDALIYSKVAARSGVDIRFNKNALLLGRSAKTKKLVYADGVYVYEQNAIYVNPEGTRTNERLLIHELAHAIYKDKKGRLIAEKGVKNMSEEEKKRIRDDYAGEIAKDSSVEPDELNAHYAEGLLSNEYCLERVLGEEPSIKDKILSFFKRVSGDESVPQLSNEAKRLLKRYKKLFDSFAEKNRNNTSSEEIWTRTTENEQSSGERYIIERSADNKPFVVVTEDILDGISESDWVSTVKQNLATKYPNGVLVGNSDIRIDADSRKEMTFSKYMQWIRKNAPNIYADKLRATNNVDEILEATTDWVGEALSHPRNDDIKEFARGNVLLRIGNNDYTAEVVVGTRKNGKLRMYDILYLKPTQIKQKKTSKAIPANPSPEAKRKTSEIFNTIIPENSEKVNGFDEKSFDKGEKKSGNGKRWAFAGEKSETADRSLLARAEQMEAEGAESEDIRKETGWFKGNDGKWRYEIDDSQMVGLPYDVENTETTLDKLIKHDKLFKAYPQLRKLKVVIDTDFGAFAFYSRAEKLIKIQPTIFINGKLGVRGLNTLIHEIQHAIQHIEGFEDGTTPNYWFQQFKSAETDEYEELGIERDEIYDEVIFRKGMKAYDTLKRYFGIDEEIKELSSEILEGGYSDSSRLDEMKAERKKLYNKRYELEEKIWSLGLNRYFIELTYIEKRRAEIYNKYYKMYKRTSGEREAYDTQGRRHLSEEERRNQMPDIQKEDTLFLKDTDKIVQEIIDQSGGTISRRQPVSNVENADTRWALPEGVDGEDISGYNDNRGWASELLSSEDKRLFNDSLTKKNSGNSKPSFSDGKYLYEVNNKLIISDGDFENPSIDAIIDINVDNATNMQSVLEVINQYANIRERPTSSKFCKVIEARIDSSVLRVYKRENYINFNAIKGNSGATRTNGYKDFGYSGKQRYGGKGKPKLRGVNVQTDVATVEYRDGTTEHMPYDEYSGYNDSRGWASELLSGEDKRLFDDNLTKINSGNSKPNFSDGKYLYEVNNKLIISDGDFENPSIDAIIDVNVDNATNMQEVLNALYEYTNFEQGPSSIEFYKDVEAYYKASVLTLYNRKNYRNITTTSGQGYPTRPDGYKDFGYSGKQRYGGKGKPKLRGVNVQTDVATVEYRDGTTEHMPYDEYKERVKNKRWALPEGVKVEKTPTAASVTTKKKEVYQRSAGEAVRDIKLATQVALTNEQAGVEWYLKKGGMTDRNAQIVSQLARASGNMGNNAAMVAQFDFSEFDKALKKDEKGNYIMPKAKGDGILQIMGDMADAVYKAQKDMPKGERLSKGEITHAFYDYLFNMHNISRMSLNEASRAEYALIEDRLTEAKKERAKAKRKLAPYKSKVESAAATLRVFQDKLKLTKTKDGVLGKLVEGYQKELNEAKEAARPFEAALKEADKKVKAIDEELKAFVPEENKPVFGENKDRGRDHDITAEESKEIVAWYEKQYPSFKEFGAKVHQFFRNNLQHQVWGGMISQKDYDFFVKRYPYYVPTDRVAQFPTISAVKGKNTMEVKNAIRKASGGGIDLSPLLETATERTIELYRIVGANQMANAVYEAQERLGDTKEVEILSREKVKKFDPDATPDKPKLNQVTFYRNGEKITMRVTSEIYAGFKALSDTTQYNDILRTSLKKGMDVFKGLVTDKNPLFLVTNKIKDTFDAMFNTRYLGKFLWNSIRMKGVRSIVTNSDMWQLNLATGGMSSSIFNAATGYDANVSRRGLKKVNIGEDDGVIKRGYKQTLGWLGTQVSNANAIVEQGTRMIELQSALQSGATVFEAMLDAAEVTTNFGRKGAVAKHFNACLMPFLNAQIQGSSRIYRNLTGSFKEGIRGISRLLFMAAFFGIAPQVINQLLMGDDDEYEELRDSDKQNYFIFRIGETLVKIPKGRVMSAYAGAVVQVSHLANGEDVDLKEYGSSLLSTLTPVESAQRTILSPLIRDLPTNTTWYGSAIEGAQFDNTQPKDRYDENTSSIAIAIGQLINYSPKKIHYLIDQYTGIIGDVILPLTTLSAERGIVASKFTIDGTSQNKLSSEFYKIYEQAQYARTAGDENAVYRVLYLNRVKSEISDLFEQKQKIQSSRELSDYEKLQQTRVIQALISEVYRKALNDYELVNTAIAATEGLGYSAADATEKKLRFTEVVHIAYGAERALAEYNSDVYAKMQVLNKGGIDYESLYAYYFATKGLESDTDKQGNAVSGSKRKKVVAAINGLNLRTEQKLLLICAKGYSLKDGDIRGVSAENAKRRLLKYITSLKGISATEKAEIAKMCGFTVKNGRIIMSKS